MPRQVKHIKKSAKLPKTVKISNKSITRKTLRKQNKKELPRWKKILKWTLIVLASIILVVGLYLGGKFLYNSIKLFGVDGTLDGFSSTPLRGEDQGRVNFLLAGNSSDQEGHGGAELTDSIMIASLGTTDNSGFLLSVPRDLYVDIPGYGYAKINEAYQAGENMNFSEPGYPQGGMGLLSKVISDNFGIEMHYYALVNYTALEEAVSAVGGIDVTIASSDSRGLYDPSRDLTTGGPLVDLPNGTSTLNGHQALNLARARGNSYGSYGYARGDFTRTENQRLIITALAAKAASVQTLANPVKLGELFDTVGRNVKTDMTLGEVRRLHEIIQNIPRESIKSVGLNDVNGENYLASYTTDSGQSALIPAAGLGDFSQIQAYITKLTAPPSETDQSDNDNSSDPN
jgi:polyisoprenyl-teichoic acid--peptidoglycan teichoic acid transferase